MVAPKSLLEGPYSAKDWPPVRPLGQRALHPRLIRVAGTYSSDDRRSLDQLLRKRVPDHRADTRASLIATLLLSLGLWAGTWGAITSLASVVLR